MQGTGVREQGTVKKTVTKEVELKMLQKPKCKGGSYDKSIFRDFTDGFVYAFRKS